jgi:hypothetical protein
MAGHKGDAVTWFENGFWTTSSAYGTMPFVENFAKANPVQADLGKKWELSSAEEFLFVQRKGNRRRRPR